MRFTVYQLMLAAGLFVPLFVFSAHEAIDFWWWMTFNIIFLLAITVKYDHDWFQAVKKDFKHNRLKKFMLGLASAAFLYLVFLIGNQVAQYIFSFARSGVADVYSFKASASPLRIGILMLMIIGPGEELFWRGQIQRRLQNQIGKWPGFIVATLAYTAIHISSGNIMLVLAAAVCGIAWGFLYLRYNSMIVNVVSHTVWDILIFLVIPIGLN